MEHITNKAQALKIRIASLEQELTSLKDELSCMEMYREDSRDHIDTANLPEDQESAARGERATDWPNKPPLPLEDYSRYARQMIVPDIGLKGQVKLMDASVLIVGVGGLGCPAAAYLAAAGMGTLGLMDGDTVELSNLHRQILHNSTTLETSKVESALLYLHKLNPRIRYVPYLQRLSAATALDIFPNYDIIIDCTDNPASRYLISDAAVLLGKQLVSASALGTEGQLMVLNDPPLPAGDCHGGPCYRCIFPTPPSAATVVSCDEGGILGPVVGLMGVYQALEAIRLIVAGPTRAATGDEFGSVPLRKPPTLLLFSAFSAPPFRSIRLRPRRPRCSACSVEATVTRDSLRTGSTDYLQLCGIRQPTNLLGPEDRISVEEYNQIRRAGTGHTLIDVREKAHYDVSHLEGSINIPFSEIQSGKVMSNGVADESIRRAHSDQPRLPERAATPIYVVCRLGNDSQIAVQKMIEAEWSREGKRPVKDLRGGLKAWKDRIDHDWPFV